MRHSRRADSLLGLSTGVSAKASEVRWNKTSIFCQERHLVTNFVDFNGLLYFMARRETNFFCACSEHGVVSSSVVNYY